MTNTVNTTRTLALCAALLALQGCAPPQKNVYYDPWDQYELGRAHDCGDIQMPDMRHNTQNAATPGFGCSHQSTIAAMVVDPQDLTRPRATTPPDEQARRRVLEAYREGASTGSAPSAGGATNLIQ